MDIWIRRCVSMDILWIFWIRSGYRMDIFWIISMDILKAYDIQSVSIYPKNIWIISRYYPFRIQKISKWVDNIHISMDIKWIVSGRQRYSYLFSIEFKPKPQKIDMSTLSFILILKIWYFYQCIGWWQIFFGYPVSRPVSPFVNNPPF